MAVGGPQQWKTAEVGSWEQKQAEAAKKKWWEELKGSERSLICKIQL